MGAANRHAVRRSRTPLVVTVYWMLHIPVAAVGLLATYPLWHGDSRLVAAVLLVDIAFAAAIVVFRSVWAWRLAIFGSGYGLVALVWQKSPSVAGAAIDLVYLCLLLSSDMRRWVRS